MPGFLVNRIQRAMSREAFSLVDHDYVNIEDVDRAIKTSIGIRLPIVGVFQTYDFTGLDVLHKSIKETSIELASTTGTPGIVNEKVARGELGIKTGMGLYDYSKKSKEDVLEARDLNYLRLLKTLDECMSLL